MAATPPLSPHVPIADDQGRPTPQFIQWWTQQRGVNNLIIPLTDTSEVSAVLDLIGDTPGALLTRGAGGWQMLVPGAVGTVLTAQAAGQPPAFAALPPPPPTPAFTALPDTPANYTGAAGMVATVNANEDGLEFATSSGGSSDFLGLTDTPADYIGQGGKVVSVKSSEDGLEFVSGGGGGGCAGLTWSPLTVTNGDFETGDGTGWTTDIGSVRIEKWASISDYNTAGMSLLYNGVYFYNGGENGSGLGGAQSNVSSYQDISIPANSVAISVAADAYKNFADSDHARLTVTIYDSGSVILGEYTTVTGTGTLGIGHYPLGITLMLPPSAATMRIRLECKRASGTNNNSGIDNVRAWYMAPSSGGAPGNTFPYVYRVGPVVAFDTGAYASKGNIVKVQRDVKIREVLLSSGITQTVKLLIAKTTASNPYTVTSKLYESAAVSMTNGVEYVFPKIDLALDIGDTVAFVFVRTDGTGTSSCGVQLPAISNTFLDFSGALKNVAYVYLANNSPGISTNLYYGTGYVVPCTILQEVSL